MRRSWLLALGSLIVLLSWHVATAEVPNSAWLMYKNPQDAGFSMSSIRRIKDYCSLCGVAFLFVVYRGRDVLAWGDYQRRFQCHSTRKSLMNAVMGGGRSALSQGQAVENQGRQPPREQHRGDLGQA